MSIPGSTGIYIYLYIKIDLYMQSRFEKCFRCCCSPSVSLKGLIKKKIALSKSRVEIRRRCRNFFIWANACRRAQCIYTPSACRLHACAECGVCTPQLKWVDTTPDHEVYVHPTSCEKTNSLKLFPRLLFMFEKKRDTIDECMGQVSMTWKAAAGIFDWDRVLIPSLLHRGQQMSCIIDSL